MPTRNTVHALWLFDASGAILFYKEWYRPRNLLKHDMEEDAKFIFGIVFSLDMLTPQLAAPHDADREAGFRRYLTETYALHHLATASGLHWVLMTSPDMQSAGSLLDALYANAYVPHVAMNVLQPLGKKIVTEAFGVEIDKIIALHGVQALAELPTS